MAADDGTHDYPHASEAENLIGEIDTEHTSIADDIEIAKVHALLAIEQRLAQFLESLTSDAES